MRVENVDQVIAILKRLSKKYGAERRVSVAVGYQTAYALFCP